MHRLLLLLLLLTPWAAAQPAVKDAGPASLAGFSDAATFRVYVNEEPLIVIKARWTTDGRVEREMTLSMAGQTLSERSVITPDARGRWQRIDVKRAPKPDLRVERDGLQVKLYLAGKLRTQFKISNGTSLYDNYNPLLLAVPVRAYDRTKGGEQKLKLMAPGAEFGATLEHIGTETASVAGKDLRVDGWTLALPGAELILFSGPQQRILRVEVPAQKAAYVRDGFEALGTKAKVDPLLSQPKHAITTLRGEKMKTRDGVALSTDIYRPKGRGRHPAILIRTPYKKEMMELQGRYYARRGYLVAIQDVRGRFASEGEWEPFVNEPNDGYDAVEWVAARPDCTGKVGMIGASYVGWVQWWAARERPPHLVTIIPNVAPPDPFFNIPYEYGAFFLLGSIWWAEILETEATADLAGRAMERIGGRGYGKQLLHLPVIDLDTKILGKKNPYWRQWIAHPNNDDYWARANFSDRLKHVRIPVFHQSGWFDGDGIGSKLNYLAMKQHGHPHQKLVLGPWGHTDTATRAHGGTDHGPAALMDLQRAYLRWFDFWLKGVDNGITKEPLVSLFVMGAKRWLHGQTYPLEGTRFEPWYLDSDGQANTSKGDGRLSPDAPTGAPHDRYVYDPADPTPHPGYYDSEEARKITDNAERAAWVAGQHDRVSARRKDLLVYLSAPLEKPLTICGPVSAVIYASSSAKDTDWFVSLAAVDPKGKIHGQIQGKLRARFHRSMRRPELLEPGTIYPFRLDLWQTGFRFPKGWRLRVEVASALFPLFGRNLNTGGHNETETRFVKATNTIHHDLDHRSHVLLPVIPETRMKSPYGGK